MPLALDARRLLPPGLHDATLAEVEEHFARFQRTDRRMTLFKKLQDYATAIQRSGLKCNLIIDGSFVMAGVDEPEDIDMIRT